MVQVIKYKIPRRTLADSISCMYSSLNTAAGGRIHKRYIQIRNKNVINQQGLTYLSTGICVKIILCNWSFNSTDVNILYNEILNTCYEVINAVAPIQHCKYRNDIPWLDSELHNEIKIRDASYKDFNASSGNEKHNKWEIFKKHRNDIVGYAAQVSTKWFFAIVAYKNFYSFSTIAIFFTSRGTCSASNILLYLKLMQTLLSLYSFHELPYVGMVC
nr:unnamed protein product [Callosobruchus analis]